MAAPTTPPPEPAPSPPAPGPLAALFCVTFGVLMTLAVQGYRFGSSNHTVYFFDVLRAERPDALRNDWFSTRTLQYHAAFGWLTRTLARWDVLEAGCLIAYLALAILLHAAWYLLVRRLGGRPAAYLLSVLFFHLSAGGTGLGVYHFLQDGSFLPSNVANVAMLWGLYFLIAARPAPAGVCLGVAGLFHLNHALVALGLCVALPVWRWWSARRDGPDRPSPAPHLGGFLLGSAVLLGLSLVNIVPAVGVALRQRGALSLSEFVDLYVRLRHPHHYVPSSWPLALWVCWLWPVPLAILTFWGRRDPSGFTAERREAGRIYVLLLGLQVVALLGAGVWYVSEALVQMSLYRFSIYVALLGYVAAGLTATVAARREWAVSLALLTLIATALLAVLLAPAAARHLPHPWLPPAADFLARRRGTLGLLLVLACIPPAYAIAAGRLPRRRWSLLHAGGTAALTAALLIGWDRSVLGLNLVPTDDADYLDVCRWAADPSHTPEDVVFVVPPDEQAFRLHARRAIVVNFKGVPQLGGELPEWRDRLMAVLDLDGAGLRALPRPFPRTLAAIRARYDALPAGHLVAVARRYGATYILVGRPLPDGAGVRLVFRHPSGRYFLYHLPA